MDDAQASFCTFIPAPVSDEARNKPDFTWQCVQCAKKGIECYQIPGELRNKAVEVAEVQWMGIETWGLWRSNLKLIIKINCPTGDLASNFRLHCGRPGREEEDYDTTGPRSKDFNLTSEQIDLAKMKKDWRRMHAGVHINERTLLLEKIQDMQDQLALERRSRQN
ncbi:hypothetical protein KVT40_006118 [Elsinoe batatas]|uniref:Uncharacterized protein n=1 Tax=Elsinoe batatas TaxID=2601811 RepID=A0A8K0KYG5_9PEZI|nr:hypothetical protein KVT40_006118 [Elsinoe batatas]